MSHRIQSFKGLLSLVLLVGAALDLFTTFQMISLATPVSGIVREVSGRARGSERAVEIPEFQKTVLREDIHDILWREPDLGETIPLLVSPAREQIRINSLFTLWARPICFFIFGFGLFFSTIRGYRRS